MLTLIYGSNWKYFFSFRKVIIVADNGRRGVKCNMCFRGSVAGGDDGKGEGVAVKVVEHDSKGREGSGNVDGE